jgi:hypothetical protein
VTDVGYQVLHVDSGVEGVDEVLQRGRVEDDGNTVCDREDAAEKHQHLVQVVRKTKQVFYFTGNDFFRIGLFVLQVEVVEHLVSVGKLYLLLNELLH